MTEKKIENFDFKKMRELYENGPLKDNLDCKNYIEKFFIPLTNGAHVLIEDNKIEMINNDAMNTVYLQRFEDCIKKWYKQKTTPKKLICDINKPRLGDNFVNASAQLEQKYVAFKTFSKETQESVKLMLSFIKEVWANENDECFEYILKWFANVLSGNKNKTALYAKSIEGIGKSTLIDFFAKYVINPDLYAKGDTDVLITSNNMSTLGKVLVVFEELPVLNTGQWNMCDGKLKDMITGDELNYCDKYEKKIKASNISNYIIVTNHKALKRPDGRRYYIADLNTKYQNNFEYFDKIHKRCFNKDVGYAFFCYLKEIDISKFNSANMPMTENKKDAVVELLSQTEKFLKFNYVLKENGIKCKNVELYREYVTYMQNNAPDYKCDSLLEFIQNMKSLGFEFKPIGGYNVYRITIESLKEVAVKKHWLHKLDSDIVASSRKKYFEAVDDDEDALENGVDKTDKTVKLSLEEQIEHYTKLLNDLKKKRLEEITTGFYKNLETKYDLTPKTINNFFS